MWANNWLKTTNIPAYNKQIHLEFTALAPVRASALRGEDAAKTGVGALRRASCQRKRAAPSSSNVYSFRQRHLQLHMTHQSILVVVVGGEGVVTWSLHQIC